VIIQASKRFFFEKKAPRPGKQKTFGPWGIRHQRVKARRKQKFFCFFFFKKRSAYFDNIGSLVALILFRSAAAEQITKTP
jgi:hypothetical protein